ncbi:hypothetical protein B566_EDAN010367 [Ephemera danica]|nr:hypothetical protein B566_EDAN010367 [Ephemera danica]
MGFSSVVYIVLPVLLLGVILGRKYRVRKWGHCQSKRLLDGQICIVTGANSGIGKEVAKDLATRKAKVILACRDLESTKTAIEDIRKTVSTGELIPMHLDLASLDSVRKFAEEVLKQFPQINILVNNAGVWCTQPQTTSDGFEIHFGINHLGHFLLTNLLLPKLKESKPCRVVTVSSGLHERGVIELDNLNFEKSDGIPPKKGMNPAYCNSKLANALFSQELSVRAPPVATYAVCPGFTLTGLFRNYKPRFYQYILFTPVIYWSMRTAKQGAQTVIHCCVAEELEGETGAFYRNCERYVSTADLNPKLASDLWTASEQLVGLSA